MNKKLKILLIITVLLLTGCSKKIDSNNKKEVGNNQLAQNEENINGNNKYSEDDFINQGSAKAILDETDLWTFHEDKNTGFNLKYPHDITFNDKNNKNGINLLVEVDKIDSLESTMGYNKETALKNKKSLSDGNFGESVDFPQNVSKKISLVDGVSAQDFLVLSRFEVCNVTFERKLYFFVEDFQVLITLSGPTEGFVDALDDYLAIDTVNCGNQKIWTNDSQNKFYEDLKSVSAPESVQYWYDVFDKIIKTIDIYEKKDSLSIVEKLQGRWESVDDSNSIIEFIGDKKLDYYNNQIMSEDTFTLADGYIGDILEKGAEGMYLTVGNPGDYFEYSLVSVTDKELILTYLSRGNTLKFKRK
jgi:hypothetical protein